MSATLPMPISSAAMIEALTAILGRAEESHQCGVASETAISHAIGSQRVSVAIEIAARVVWSQMIEPMHTPGPAVLSVFIEPRQQTREAASG